MKNSIKFHGDHYTMWVNGKEARLGMSLRLLNPEDFTFIETVLIRWSVV